MIRVADDACVAAGVGVESLLAALRYEARVEQAGALDLGTLQRGAEDKPKSLGNPPGMRECWLYTSKRRWTL